MIVYGLNPVLEALRARRVQSLRVSARHDTRIGEVLRLAGGAGVTLGRARVRPVGPYAGARVVGLPVEALRDAARIYVLVIPLFAIASSFEFLAR